MDRRTGVLARAFAITGISLCLILLAHGRGFAGQCETNGACYVTPTGAGTANGVDWNNAYAGLPTSWSSTSCGVTYYVAGGTYDYTATSNTISSACSAGTPLIIYKAVSGGPGNPQSVAGWQASYGTTQAFFSQSTDADPQKVYNPFFTLSGSYITIDGVVPASGTPTKTSTFGIHLQSSNFVGIGFLSVTGANNTVKHVELDGIGNPYGFQVTACSRMNTGQVTVTTNGNPPWVVGDEVDLYMNGGTPTDFSTVPPSTGWTITSISGNQLQYTQTGNTNVETCSFTANPNPATVVLNYGGAAGVIPNIGANPSNFSFTDSYVHDIAVPIHSNAPSGCNNCTYLRNYITRNHSTPTDHSEALGGGVLNNSVIGQSIFEDINGTSITNPTCSGACNWQNDAIYSNLVFCTIASQSAYVGPPTGATWQSPQCNTSSVFSDDNGSNQVTNLLIYGNTIVRPLNCIIYISNASSTGTVVNNFMYCPSAKLEIQGFPINNPAPTNMTHSYNTGWSNALNQAPTPGVGDYFTTTFPAATSVFVDPTDATENFRLLSETVDSSTSCTPGTNCLKDGLTLSSPYNLDLIGATRGADGTWERGAYEFNSSPTKPNPPTALNVTGVH